jgi:hypothetical protein
MARGGGHGDWEYKLSTAQIGGSSDSGWTWGTDFVGQGGCTRFADGLPGWNIGWSGDPGDSLHAGAGWTTGLTSLPVRSPCVFAGFSADVGILLVAALRARRNGVATVQAHLKIGRFVYTQQRFLENGRRRCRSGGASFDAGVEPRFSRSVSCRPADSFNRSKRGEKSCE